MTVTYIIAPFASSEYLMRCINSIKRQTLSDYEVIIAENSFYENEKLIEYLANTDKLKLISDDPKDSIAKIREAASLASPASKLIKLIAADTVVSPIATAEAQRDDDIIIASCAEKSDNGYKVTDNSFTAANSRLSIYSMFLKKNIFEELNDEVFTEKQVFDLWLEEQINGGTHVVTTDKVCFYTAGKAMIQYSDPSKININISIKYKDRILESIKTAFKANSITKFDKYLSRFLTFLFDKKGELSLKNDIFSFIKEMGEAAKSNPPAKRLFELYLNEDLDFIRHIDAEGYLLYIEKKNVFSKISFYQSTLPKPASVEADARAIEKDMAADVKAIRKDVAADVKTIRNDIAAISKNMHFVFDSSFSAGTAKFNDSSKQVPEMFSQGRLGLRVILKSIKGWLKYKLSRKKV